MDADKNDVIKLSFLDLLMTIWCGCEIRESVHEWSRIFNCNFHGDEAFFSCIIFVDYEPAVLNPILKQSKWILCDRIIG
jgi:hypothetical protein